MPQGNMLSANSHVFCYWRNHCAQRTRPYRQSLGTLHISILAPDRDMPLRVNRTAHASRVFSGRSGTFSGDFGRFESVLVAVLSMF